MPRVHSDWWAVVHSPDGIQQTLRGRHRLLLLLLLLLHHRLVSRRWRKSWSRRLLRLRGRDEVGLQGRSNKVGLPTNEVLVSGRRSLRSLLLLLHGCLWLLLLLWCWWWLLDGRMLDVLDDSLRGGKQVPHRRGSAVQNDIWNENNKTWEKLFLLLSMALNLIAKLVQHVKKQPMSS